MKILKNYLDTILLTVILVGAVFVLGASAEPVPGVGAPIAPAVAAVAASDAMTPIINAVTGKFGWAVQALAVIGTLRVIFKPTVAWLHSIADATATDRDNQILAKIEASKIYTTLAFVLDWLASIKVGPSKPIPAVLDTAAANKA